jgi:hypothetical protein
MTPLVRQRLTAVLSAPTNGSAGSGSESYYSLQERTAAPPRMTSYTLSDSQLN